MIIITMVIVLVLTNKFMKTSENREFYVSQFETLIHNKIYVMII